MPEPVTRLGMFAKHWTPGRVKTRLAAQIGAERAADLYRVFVETLLDRLAGIAQQSVLCYWPPESRGEFEAIAPEGWKLAPQAGGDLGNRMQQYFVQSFESGVGRAVLVGSDAPNLPRRLVEQALELLDHARVVLGPARDGGYYLVGASDSAPPIFQGIDWSTDRVWRQTIDRLSDAGWERGTALEVLPDWHDVDDLAGLQHLHEELQAQSAGESSLDRLGDAVWRTLPGVARRNPKDAPQANRPGSPIVE